MWEICEKITKYVILKNQKIATRFAGNTWYWLLGALCMAPLSRSCQVTVIQ